MPNIRSRIEKLEATTPSLAEKWIIEIERVCISPDGTPVLNPDGTPKVIVRRGEPYLLDK
jgi:hypothetical protein